MSQVCELTGKRPNYGNTRSHANNKSRTRWELNLKTKKVLVPELGRSLRLLLSTHAIKTIDKFSSFTSALMDAKEEKLSERLQKLKAQVQRSRVRAAKPKAAGEKIVKKRA